MFVWSLWQSTYGTDCHLSGPLSKQAIRDVFKRLWCPWVWINPILRKSVFEIRWTTAYEKNLQFRQVIIVKWNIKAFEIVERLMGIPARPLSMQLGSLWVTKIFRQDYILPKYGEDMSSLSMMPSFFWCWSHGLLKNGFPCLRNLTLSKMQGIACGVMGVHLKIEDIDLEDKEPGPLCCWKYQGILQFEQPGAIRLLKRVQLQVFEEVVATTSSMWPGRDYIDNFCRS